MMSFDDLMLALPVLPWLIPLILLLAALRFFRRIRLTQRRGAEGEFQVGQVLERLFRKVRHDLILPDGRGGLTQIDHLVLTPAGLLVVETKNYRGAIFGQADEATWTQVLGGKRHALQNPLRQNHAHLKALQAIGLGIPVLGRVVFTNAASFPKGLPEGVSQVHTLRDDLANLRRGRVPAAIVRAWKILLTHARTDRAARRAHRRGLRARFGLDSRARHALTLLMLAVICTGGLAWHQRFSLTSAAIQIHSAMQAGAAILRR